MPFTVALHSRDRVGGTTSQFTIALASALPPGKYKATFKICSDVPTQSELLIRWSGMQRQYSSSAVDSFVCVCCFDIYGSSGCAYFESAGQNIDVAYVDAATRQALVNYPESTILVTFEEMIM